MNFDVVVVFLSLCLFDFLFQNLFYCLPGDFFCFGLFAFAISLSTTKSRRTCTRHEQIVKTYHGPINQVDIFNLCVTSRIVSAFFCSFTFLRFRVVPSSFLLEFHFGSCSELVILHYSGVLFLSLPSFGSPCFPLSSFFFLLSFCLFHFHFHFYFTAYGWFFTFVSLFYQRISVAGEVNTKRHTSK